MLFRFDLDPSSAELLTRTPGHLDISDIASDFFGVPKFDANVLVYALNQHQLSVLQSRARSAAPMLLGLDMAEARIGKAVRTVFKHASGSMVLPTDPGMAARTLFARDELVQVPEMDAFDVAATLLAKFYAADQASPIPHGSRNPRPKFKPLDPDSISYEVEQFGQVYEIDPHLRDEATRDHQQIVADLARMLIDLGIQPSYNDHVDVRGVLESADVLFEIKTANCSNLVHQARLAVGQLLEYRFRYRGEGSTMRLVLVMPERACSSNSRFVQGFLDDLGIFWLRWDGLSAQLDLAGLMQTLSR